MVLTRQNSVLLNLIRGVSAQLVLIGHLLAFYDVYGTDDKAGQFLMQNFGVTIFFILSGFIITYSVHNKNADYKFRDYFIDRFTRIYVAYLPAIFVIACLGILAKSLWGQFPYMNQANAKNFFGNVFLLQDFPVFRYISYKFNLPEINISSYGTARPFWTVAIEWWMYMLFGFLLYRRFNFRSLLPYLFLLIVPAYNLMSGGNALCVVWLLGVLAFMFSREYQTKIRKPGWLATLFILLAIARLNAIRWDVYDVVFSILLASAFFCIITVMQNHNREYKSLMKWGRFADRLASFSFSLYLLHYTVIIHFIQLELPINKWVQMVICFILSNMVSYLFAWCTEFRYHHVRNYIRKRLIKVPVKSSEVLMQP